MADGPATAPERDSWGAARRLVVSAGLRCSRGDFPERRGAAEVKREQASLFRANFRRMRSRP